MNRGPHKKENCVQNTTEKRMSTRLDDILIVFLGVSYIRRENRNEREKADF